MLRQVAPAKTRHIDVDTVQRAIGTLLLGVLATVYLPASTLVSETAVEGNSAPPYFAARAPVNQTGRLIPISRTIVERAAISIQIESEHTFQAAMPKAQPANRPYDTPRMTQNDAPNAVTVLIVGDIMLGRQVAIEMNKRDDFSWPFRRTVGLLRSADLTLGNLESPIVSGCPFSSEGMVFCAVPRAAEGLAWAGIDAVSLANNHAYTYNTIGFEQTVDYLRQAEIEPIPAGVLALRQIGGIQVGILSFDDSNSRLDVERAVTATRAASHQVDVLIGLMHWGIEYQVGPNLRQREVGHALVDAGMDVIAGAHPHRVQPVEKFNGKLIVYSLGNFVFDQMWWEETMQGEVIRLQLVETSDGIIVDYQMIPIQIYDYGQPAVIEPGR